MRHDRADGQGHRHRVRGPRRGPVSVRGELATANGVAVSGPQDSSPLTFSELKDSVSSLIFVNEESTFSQILALSSGICLFPKMYA